MNQEDQTPHIGALIKAELKRQGRTTVWFASQLGFTRENCYKIYRHSWIQTDTLVNISKILHHDFFKDISNYLNL
ncbi:MAG: hypothetical protein MJ009_00215 [Paludibacteraceae bacterium]|nr:hypothetical protein [Paludibacteraceae bacterium]